MGLLKGHVLLAWNLIREGLTEMFHFISKRFVMKIDLFPISVFVSDDNFNSDGKRQLYLFLFIRGKLQFMGFVDTQSKISLTLVYFVLLSVNVFQSCT